MRFNPINAAVMCGILAMTADTGGAAGGDAAAGDALATTTPATTRDKSGEPVLFADQAAMEAATGLKKGYQKFVVTDSTGAKNYVAARASDLAIGFFARTKLGYTAAAFGKAPRGATAEKKTEALLDSMTDEQRKAIIAKYLATTDAPAKVEEKKSSTVNPPAQAQQRHTQQTATTGKRK